MTGPPVLVQVRALNQIGGTHSRIRSTSVANLLVALGAIDNPNSRRLIFDFRKYEFASENSFLASSKRPCRRWSLPSSTRYST